MAGSQLTLFVSLLLLSFALAYVTASEDLETKKLDRHVHVVVEGMVYCQSCERSGTWSLTGAEPIPAAKVSVICKDHKNRVSYYKAFETDPHGYFYGELEGFRMGHYFLDHPLHACKVKLVSSPLESCNLLTNVNYGLNGSPLRYENKWISGKHYEAVIYASSPLAFRPAQCTPSTPH
ncbi:hypothetical protein RJ639_001178 [Escallonia herrerae]|uniref:Uncharacterized protein n=1 Tax=Escallonia herrerae TaxID=1293975 RepID=A0AA88XQW0_9ASTE|nr:hypothetical protein RJ639_001178 [Escallonia herrerae]